MSTTVDTVQRTVAVSSKLVDVMMLVSLTFLWLYTVFRRWDPFHVLALPATSGDKCGYNTLCLWLQVCNLAVHFSEVYFLVDDRSG